MQFTRLSKRLEGISDASKKGYPIRNLYRLMLYETEIWYEAYANIYSNNGAITKGISDNTLDGFSSLRVDNITKALTEEKYRFTPARRVYIPKRTGNKKRPLGIPTGDNKLVQEVARIILERIYEPIFSDNSHGFRPRRSCHTVLEQVSKQWTGMKWFIEFDIRGFFDNMDHEIMIELLSRKIDDKRFIKLIKSMLKAGYLEDFQYHPTYSGTPQGPEGKALSFCQRYGYGDWQAMKPIHRPEISNASDVEIIHTYNAELRGLANYYCLASDVKQKLSKLEYMVHYSLLKTLANKHKTKTTEILKRLRQGNEFVHEYVVKGQVRKLKVFRLKHISKKPKDWNIDEIPNTLYLAAPGSELVKRLNYKECEYCGRKDIPLESHHVRKLKDLKKKPNKKIWEQVMIARKRKTLIICIECHDLLHAGKLSDKRYRDNAELESRVQ